jgi:CheY-like chemotaxis protein
MIIFIDDEKRRMSSYAEELEFSLDREVHFETDVDAALDFLNTQDPRAIELVILDVMMSPGKYFQNENTESGLKTGLLLYKKIRSQNKKVPIVIFTNASDAALTKDDVTLAKTIETDQKCLLLRKEDFLPDEFSKELSILLKL